MSGAKGAGQTLRRQSALALGAAALLIGAAAAIWWLSSGAGDVVHIDDPRRLTPAPLVAVAPEAGAAGAEVRPTIRKVAGMKRVGATTRPSPQFIMSMAADAHGRLWIGTEDTGVFCYNPQDQQWQRFTAADGLGDDHAYAVACDRQGRIWAGHLNHGVSVYVEGSGEEGTKARRHEGTQGKWQNYEVVGGLSSPTSLSGPLGERVFDIAGCPTDGDVWIATDHGLSRYRQASDDWVYYTRAEGLPSDQVQALAFGPDGTLYVGTQCDGIAIAKANEQYRTWRTVRGPERMPTVPAGEGLPTSLINDLLVGSDGTIYAATTLGLALSKDGGTSWRYWRGEDWADKVRGLYGGPPKGWREEPGARLAEDYVTCLAEAGPGRVLVGYRRRGCELLEAAKGEMRRVMPLPFYANALAPLGQSLFIGGYGDGLVSIPSTTYGQTPSVAATAPPEAVALPSGAKAPTAAELAGMLDKVRSLTAPLPPTYAAYLGDDWMTQGDWVGRYGRQHNMLCAMMSPFNQQLVNDNLHKVAGRIGPHHGEGDALRGWIHWEKTTSPRCLYNPIAGVRRQAEWDDHGEAYPTTHEGPDIWVNLTLPAGVQRTALYFMNKDGYSGENRLRDYIVEVYDASVDPNSAVLPSPLCRARVRDFRGGVYKQISIRGPGQYYIRVVRSASLNTLVSGIFVDRVRGKATWFDRLPLAWMGSVDYRPPDPPRLDRLETASDEPTGIKAAQGLWWAMNEAYDAPASLPMQWAWRVGALRVASASGDSALLEANWRWTLCLWTDSDRRAFRDVMDRAWESQVKETPAMVWEERQPLVRGAGGTGQ